MVCFLHVSFACYVIHFLFNLDKCQLSFQKYANVFENERVGMVELPYLSEERLQKMGVPLGPRLRIMQEAQISVCKDNTLCIV